MSAEAEHILKEAATVTNERSKSGRLTQKATRYLRFGERQRREDEKVRLAKTLDPLNIQISKMSDTNVQMARRAYQSLTAELEDQSPPTDLSGETKDAVHARRTELEAQYRALMLPREIMRRNPVGAVDKFNRGENSAAGKRMAMEIKNLRLLENPDSDELDTCNLENLRPEMGQAGEASRFMADAQISGNFAMSPQAKANWPEGMPEYGEVNSPWRQALERENKELRDKLVAIEIERRASHIPGPKKHKWTPEQKEAARLRGVKLHKIRMAQQEAKLAEATAHLVDKE